MGVKVLTKDEALKMLDGADGEGLARLRKAPVERFLWVGQDFSCSHGAIRAGLLQAYDPEKDVIVQLEPKTL